MAPFLVLITTFAILFIVYRISFRSYWDISLVGRIAFAITLTFIAMSHFTRTNLMIDMMPSFIPYKKAIIYTTGVIEFLGVIGLVTGKLSKITSIFLIALFILLLPAYISGIWKDFGGGQIPIGTLSFYFRIPVLMILIFWSWYFGIHKNVPEVTRHEK